MTRAKRSLVLSRAIYRRSYGEERMRASLPSRFLAEIPARSDRSGRRIAIRAGRNAPLRARSGIFRRLFVSPHVALPIGQAPSASGPPDRPSSTSHGPRVGQKIRSSARACAIPSTASARSSKSKAKAKTAGSPSAFRITAPRNCSKRYCEFAARLECTPHSCAIRASDPLARQVARKVRTR